MGGAGLGVLDLAVRSQAFNFAYQFRDDGTNEKQAERDVFFGVILLIFLAVYAHDWPTT